MTIKVLIVEDDPMVARLNENYLDMVEGFECVGHAASGEEAKVMLSDTPADLLLLDIYMQHTNGLQLLSSLRGQENPVDVIVISAASDNGSIRKALQLGAIDYLIKPFEFKRLDTALTSYRQHHRMIKQRHLSQEELDQIMRKRSGGVEEAASNQPLLDGTLPKGLTEATLRTIWEILRSSSPAELSTEDIAAAAPVSRISVRKYLNYLTEIGALSMEIRYGSVGRPVYMYAVTDLGIRMFD
ncbi:two-component system response regulator DcuR [Paenibacillus sp. CAA11]|uniref:response regulator n=1 Tax=Paenibacillus sp. CAA11 TaxID=1532905 RepID=UPI000D382131|nr:response regulator [Paenibacillus sp. CAA11]AWB46520.1 two-component system response regulator DcuR [Paenibacillus sp. CAA11]